MLEMNPGIPRKVLARAQELGIHNDCISAGEGSCDLCKLHMLQSFEFFYGTLPTQEEKLHAILTDLFIDFGENSG